MRLSYEELAQEDIYKSGHLLCAGCPGSLLWRNALQALGKDIIVSMGATCIAAPTFQFPSAVDVPSIYIAMAPAASGISGISAALKVLRRKGKLKDDGKTKVISISGDGSTADIGMASLSGTAERNDDGIYICFDNEAYMNTGIQRTSQTPYKTWTTSTVTGKPQGKKDMSMIMAAHGIPYVATASVGHPDDFIKKVEKAASLEEGFKYIHVLSPCPTGWRFPEEYTVEVSRLAVDSGMWLLYEIEHGNFNLTYRLVRRKPVKEYLQMQGRFSHLTDEDITEIQQDVEAKCRKFGI